MTKMNSQRRSLSAALDMVEAAISSLEQQAQQAKQFQQQPITTVPSDDQAAAVAIPLQQSHVQENRLGHEQECDSGKRKDDQIVTDTNNMNSLKVTTDENDQVNAHKVISSNLHKKHKTDKKIRSTAPGVLLHNRISTPRKKSHRRSGSSSSRHHRSSSRREKNNNSSSALAVSGDKEKNAKVAAEKTSRYSQPTLSSRMREELTERPKKKEKTLLPFVPVGSQGKSYHVGVIIQKELGQLKSQPLEVWAAAKQNAAKQSKGGSTILQRALTKS